MLPGDILRDLQREREDLLVLVDTLQTNLRTVSSYLTEEELKEVNTRSYKWCLNWKPKKS